MSTRRIIEAFETWSADGRTLVLATVTTTEGSTYSKAGHCILIADNGDYRGLVSGGCLEGDLAAHASRVADNGEPAALIYDLRDEADGVFGLGIGCNGMLGVLLQRLESGRDYQPFRRIAQCQFGHDPAVLALVVDSEVADLPLGASLVLTAQDSEAWQIPAALRGGIESQCRELLHAEDAELRAPTSETGAFTVLYAPIRRIPRLLLLGAGPDAVPLVRIARELGWITVIADHRPARINHPDFSLADETLEIEPGSLADSLILDEFDAAVIMSHHLETDRLYLSQLASSTLPYIGLLGPSARRERLLAELGARRTEIEARLHGPVGLDIGADSPESIALSILAEIQSQIATRARPGQ